MFENLSNFYLQVVIPLFSYLSNFGKLCIEFLFRDFAGQPLIYWLFGAGVFTYLAVKITAEIVK